jgi:hypothetical protein
VTNKTSKISRSTAAAGLAAILMFGVASVHEAAAARIQRAQHRQPHTVQAPTVPRNGNGAYDSSELYDWSHWSPSHHPGWPCVSTSSSDASHTSAYPAWEVKPGCK